MEYKIIKRVNATSLADAIKKESSGEIVIAELCNTEDFDPQYIKELGFKNGR